MKKVHILKLAVIITPLVVATMAGIIENKKEQQLLQASKMHQITLNQNITR